MARYNITDDVNIPWLRQISIDIMEGKITMKEAAEHAQFDSIMGPFEKSISDKSLHMLLVTYGYTPLKRGREGHASHISEEAAEFINKNQEDLKIGTRKMYELCRDSNIAVSRRMVEDYYKKNFPQNSIKKADEYVTNYECKEVNSVWHGDIHYLHAIEDTPTIAYLYALIDDASRYIVGYDISDKKDCHFVATVFEETIQKVGKGPLIYWSDNGLENLGPEMKGLYLRYDIRHIRIKPGTPRSNGKIERFWQGINKAVAGKTKWYEINDAIDNYITYYNTMNHHRGLKKIGKEFPTPKQIFEDPEKQTTDRRHATIIVDGTEKTLSEFCKEDEENVLPGLLQITNLLN